MNAMIQWLFGLGQLGEEAYRLVYGYLKRVAIILVAVVILSICLNVIGLQLVNIWLGILAVAIIFFAACHVRVAESVLGLGAITNPVHPIDQAKELGSVWIELISNVLLYLSTFLFIMGTFSMSGRAWKFVPIVLLAIFVLVMMAVVWKMFLKIAKIVLYSYACAALVISIMMLVPDSTYQRILGGNPVSFFQSSRVDQALFDMGQIILKSQQEKDYEELRGFIKKLENGEDLSDKENDKLQHIISQNSNILAQVKEKIIGMIGDSSGEPPATTAPKRSVEIRQLSFSANQKVVTDLLVRAGDIVEVRDLTAPVLVRGSDGSMVEYQEPYSLTVKSNGNFIFNAGDKAGSLKIVLLPQ